MHYRHAVSGHSSSIPLLLLQTHVAMVTADVNIVVLTNQKVRRAHATRNMFFVMTCIPAKVR